MKSEEKMEPAGEPMKLYDKDGKEYTIDGSTESGIILKGKDELKSVPISQLSNYSIYPPKVQRAIQEICDMLKSGKITVDDLRRMRDDNPPR